jgi:hypothetical protein
MHTEKEGKKYAIVYSTYEKRNTRDKSRMCTDMNRIHAAQDQLLQ